MSEPIEFNGVGNLLMCTRCHKHANGTADDLKEFTILWNEYVPLAIICNACWLEMELRGLMHEEEGSCVLYDD